MSDTLFSAIIGAIFGGIIGGIGTYIGAVRITRRTNRTIAGIRLREAFAPERTWLLNFEGFPASEPCRILENAFPKHEAAIYEFSFFLRDTELEAFNKAWKEYHKPNSKNKCNFSPDAAVTPDAMKNVLVRMEAVLEFTKDK
ncbi:MAG TPA: hypothetical protein VFG09_03215 [Thermodesulfovibrionales bacterium]|nr:hypothetical protein [Thermodesulfovibrionales bacterium]